MKDHPLSSIFPDMDEQQFRSLQQDIEQRGLLEPIWTFEGRVLDGRHRLRACTAIGRLPAFREYEGDDPLGFVIAMNLKRRHLNESQRAMVGAEIANLPQGRPGKAANLPVSQSDAAEIVHVSERLVRDAVQVKQDADPALTEAVRRGRVAVSQAARLSSAPPETQRRIVSKLDSGEATKATEAMRLIRHEDRGTVPMVQGRYRVLYVDPPWEYGNADLQQYGHASHHYPTMSLPELCAVAVAEIAEPDAVLFLWATSPMLKDALYLMEAWGFSYKTSFVWDKVRHNFGHYNSVRHEFLLIGTRGSCTPDAKELVDSVQTIERSDVHSQKPKEFRAIIDRLYTHGARIELFSRTELPEPWIAWGNEPRPEAARVA